MFQVEEIKDSEEEPSDDEDELSFLSRRVKQLWKNRQGNFRRPRSREDHSESSARGRENKEVTCYECKELGHYINECPKLQKESTKKEFLKKNAFNRKKKDLMETWDESYSEGLDSNEEHANVAFMDTASERNTSKTDPDSKEVFSELSHAELELCLPESLSRYQKLQQKFKKFMNMKYKNMVR